MTTEKDKISSIYQQGKEQGPPGHLDSAILKAAHDAIEQEASTGNLSAVKSPFSGGWRATASIAAVLVITVILVPLIKQEEPVPAAFDAPMLELETKREQVQQEPAAAMELQLRKEKAKKRIRVTAPEAQSEQGSKLNMYSLPSASGFAGEQITAEESLAPVRSAAPAPVPASMTAPMPASGATDSVKLSQQAPKQAAKQASRPEAVGRQKSLLMMDSYISEDSIEADDLTPSQWLQHIGQLIEQGEMEAAQKELDDFKLRYPDEEIDQSITEKLKKG